MSSPFQQPAQGGDRLPDMQELIGSLVLIKVIEYRPGILTQAYGEKDAVACDVHVLDGPHGGEVFSNTLLFQGALIGSLKPAAGGQPVLARLGQGTAKPGQNAPYVLNPFTEQDAAFAGPYWASVQAKAFQAPAAAAPDPWAAQQAAAAPVPTAAAAPPAAPASAAFPAAVTPAAAPVNGMTQQAFDALPKAVQELLRQSGQVPAA